MEIDERGALIREGATGVWGTGMESGTGTGRFWRCARIASIG